MKMLVFILIAVLGWSNFSYAQTEMYLGRWKSEPQIVDDRGGVATLAIEGTKRSRRITELDFTIKYQSPYFENELTFKGLVHLATIGGTMILETLQPRDPSD